MIIHTSTLHIPTKGETDVHDLTSHVRAAVRTAAMHQGIVTVFVPGSTAGVTTIEFESGVLGDLRAALERLAPSGIRYAHDDRWGDGNGYSHVRASLLGPSLVIPVVDGEPVLGTWQQVVLIDFDNRPRRRDVIVQCVGE